MSRKSGTERPRRRSGRRGARERAEERPGPEQAAAAVHRLWEDL